MLSRVQSVPGVQGIGSRGQSVPGLFDGALESVAVTVEQQSKAPPDGGAFQSMS